MSTDTASAADVFRVANEGPVMVAELFPLSNCGKVRVRYNWLYSALNCDPNDPSPFPWVLTKQPNAALSLSPQYQYAGMTLYASVRDDWSWQVQTQAPNSAQWITQAGRDECLTLTALGTLTIELQGFNNSYVGVDSSATPHDQHTAYLMHSTVTTPGPWSQYFLAIQQNLQAKAQLPLIGQLSETEIKEAVEGASDAAALVARIRASV